MMQYQVILFSFLTDYMCNNFTSLNIRNTEEYWKNKHSMFITIIYCEKNLFTIPLAEREKYTQCVYLALKLY